MRKFKKSLFSLALLFGLFYSLRLQPVKEPHPNPIHPISSENENGISLFGFPGLKDFDVEF